MQISQQATLIADWIHQSIDFMRNPSLHALRLGVLSRVPRYCTENSIE
jgi:hypothetical protein